MDTVLIAVDGTDVSDHVRDYTKEIFDTDRHEICVVTVVPEPPDYLEGDEETELSAQYNEASEEYAEQVVQDLQDSGFEAHSSIRQGHPGEQLTQACDEEKPRAVVMGRRGLETTDEILMGSTSQFVLHNTSCPVTLITARD